MSDLSIELKTQDDGQLHRLLLAKMNHLDERIANPPEAIIDQVLQIATTKIHLFNNADVYNVFMNWMRTSKHLAIFKKNKSLNGTRNSLSRVAGAITIELLKNKLSWPLELLNIYLDDALGCRQWVDAPELSFLTQNLLEWAKYSNQAPSILQLSTAAQDESSGEEEILDASMDSMQSSSGPTFVDVCDRYRGRHDDAFNIIFSALAKRCGVEVDKLSLGSPVEYTQAISAVNPSSAALMNASSLLISTMQSFCILPPIRYLAAKCMSTWISNPALVEYVGRLLTHIGQGLYSYQSGVDNSFLESDLYVIEALIKLRPSLKLSLAEAHRNILVSVSQKCPKVTILITRLHLVENLLSRGNKPDSIKLLLHILLLIHDNDKVLSFVRTHRCAGNISLENQKNISYEYVSMILGLSIRQIISHDIYTTVDPSDCKTLLEDCLKIIRQIGVGVFCPVTMLTHLLTPILEPEYFTFFSTYQVNSFEVFPPDTVRFLSDFALSIQLLYTNSIVLVDRVERDDKRLNPPAGVTSINLNSNSESTGSSNIAGRGAMVPGRGVGHRVAGRGGNVLPIEGGSMFRSSNKVTGGRGRTVGRGQQFPVEKDPVINGEQLLVQTDDLEKNIKKTKDNYHLRSVLLREIFLEWFVGYLRQLILLFREDLSREHNDPDTPSMNVSVDCLNPSPISHHPRDDNSTEFELNDTSKVNFTRKRSNSSVSVDSVTSQPPVVERNQMLVGITMPYLIDRLQQFLGCLNLQLTTKINLDLDKMTSLVARDHQILTTECLGLLVDSLSLLCKLDQIIYLFHCMKFTNTIKYASESKDLKKSEISFLGNLSNNLVAFQSMIAIPTSVEEDESFYFNQPTFNGLPLLISAVDLIEHCLNKALRTNYQNSHGLIIENTTVIAKLFTLCRAEVFDDSIISGVVSIPTLDISLQTMGVFEESNIQPEVVLKDCLGFKDVYWKICTLCLVIGCASPKINGDFLWNNIPSVQSLLLMCISDRFFYPPSIASAESVVANRDLKPERMGFHGSSELSASSCFDFSQDGTINLNKVVHYCEQMKKLMKSLEDIYQADCLIAQEELMVWEFIFQKKIKKMSSHTLDSIGENVQIDEIVESSEGEEDDSSLDENLSINHLISKRKLRGKKVPPTKKKKRTVSKSNIRPSTDTLIQDTDPALEQDDHDLSEIAVRRSSRKHLPRFNVQEIMKDENDDDSFSEPEVEEVDADFSSEDDGHVAPKAKRNIKSRRQSKKLSQRRKFQIPEQEFSRFVTPYGVPSQQEIIFLPFQIPRVPPDDVIKSVKQYNQKYKFGKVLRLCVDPDFIASVAGGEIQNNNSTEKIDCTRLLTRITTREDILESVGWLVPAINVEINSNILQRIPPIACLHILFVLLYQNCCKFMDYLIYNEDLLNVIFTTSLSISLNHDSTENFSELIQEAKIFQTLSQSQREVLTSRDYSVDLFLCSQILDKLTSFFDMNLNISAFSSQKEIEIFYSMILLTLLSSESMLDNFEKTILRVNQILSSEEGISQYSIHGQCGIVIGLIFQEMTHSDWLRRSLARIVLQYLSVKFEEIRPNPRTKESIDFTEFFRYFPCDQSESSSNALVSELFSKLCAIETHRPTFLLLLKILKQLYPLSYPLICSKFIELSAQKPKMIAALVLPASNISDEFSDLIQEILQAISQGKDFGTVITTSTTNLEKYVYFTEWRVHIQEEFLTLCSFMLHSLFELEHQCVHHSLQEILTSCDRNMSICFEIYCSVINHNLYRNLPTLKHHFTDQLIKSSNMLFCQHVVRNIELTCLFSLFLQSSDLLSVPFLFSFFDYLEDSLVSAKVPLTQCIVDNQEYISEKFELCCLLEPNGHNKWKKLHIKFGDSKDVNISEVESELLMDLETKECTPSINHDSLNDLQLLLQNFESTQEKDGVFDFFRRIYDQSCHSSFIRAFNSSIELGYSNKFFSLFLEWVSYREIPLEDILNLLLDDCFEHPSLGNHHSYLLEELVLFLFRAYSDSCLEIWNSVYLKYRAHTQSIWLFTFCCFILQYLFWIGSIQIRAIECHSFSPSRNLQLKTIPQDLTMFTEPLLHQILSFLLQSPISPDKVPFQYQYLIDSLSLLTTSDPIIARSVTLFCFPYLLSFPPNHIDDSEHNFENSNLSVFRTLLYHAYMTFPESTIESINLWISSRPYLPLKWSQSLEKISLKSKTRLKKRSDIVEETYFLPDGRIWAEFISNDINLIFQLLMIQEGKRYLNCVNLEQFSSDNVHDIQSKHQSYQKNQMKALSNCSFDHKTIAFLQFLDDRNYLSTLESLNESTSLSHHSHLFFVALAQQHPSLFLRYQLIIKYYLTKPLIQSQNKMNSISVPTPVPAPVKPSTTLPPPVSGNEVKSPLVPKTKSNSSDASTNLVPPPLTVSINSTTKDTKMSGGPNTRNLLFTATGCEINLTLWEALLHAYESCDSLIWYLHSTTTEYYMDRVYHVFLECAERRNAFAGLMVLSPPPNSDFDIKLQSCLKATSETEVIQKVRREKRLFRLLSVLEKNILELSGLAEHLPSLTDEDLL